MRYETHPSLPEAQGIAHEISSRLILPVVLTFTLPGPVPEGDFHQKKSLGVHIPPLGSFTYGFYHDFLPIFPPLHSRDR